MGGKERDKSREGIEASAGTDVIWGRKRQRRALRAGQSAQLGSVGGREARASRPALKSQEDAHTREMESRQVERRPQPGAGLLSVLHWPELLPERSR